jgi:hypothetical protein
VFLLGVSSIHRPLAARRICFHFRLRPSDEGNSFLLAERIRRKAAEAGQFRFAADPARPGRGRRQPAGGFFGSEGMPPRDSAGIFSASSSSASADGIPPPPNICLPMPHRAALLARPMAFIMSAMFRCILSSLLTSSTLRPAPAAMRFLRLALRRSGLRAPRRHGIDHGATDA